MTIPLFMIFCWIAWVGTPIISVPLVFLGSLWALLGSTWRFACASGACSHRTRLMAIPGARRFVASQIDWINSELSAFLPLLIGVLSGTPGTSKR